MQKHENMSAKKKLQELAMQGGTSSIHNWLIFMEYIFQVKSMLQKYYFRSIIYNSRNSISVTYF